MGNVRELIQQKLKETGLNMREVSLRLGKNHAYLQQFLDREVPVRLPEDVRERLAPILGVSDSDLKEAKTFAKSYSPPNPNRSPQSGTADRIPVLGIAQGGPDGWEMWNGDIVDYIPRPSSLAGAPNAFAIYVTGTSMEPRYHPAEMLYVHPGKPITIGAYVLVQLKPTREGEGPRAVVKKLVKKNSSDITLEQFNPPKTFKIPMAQVETIHRIVGSGE